MVLSPPPRRNGSSSASQRQPGGQPERPRGRGGARGCGNLTESRGQRHTSPDRSRAFMAEGGGGGLSPAAAPFVPGAAPSQAPSASSGPGRGRGRHANRTRPKRGRGGRGGRGGGRGRGRGRGSGGADSRRGDSAGGGGPSGVATQHGASAHATPGLLPADAVNSGGSSTGQRRRRKPRKPRATAPAAGAAQRSKDGVTDAGAKGRRRGGTQRPKGAPRAPSVERKEDHGGDASASASTAENLAEKLRAETYECLVCLCRITKKSPVWSCEQCYGVLHLACINRWRKQSGVSKAFPNARWACPKCRRAYSGSVRYKCFCTKETNPESDPYLTPHSCGATCGRARGGGCPHKCDAICHPGPCAPCSAMGPLQTCGCGRTNYRLRCGAADPRAGCGAICGRQLACGGHGHRCRRVCHDGPCDDCEEMEDQWCYCGSSQRRELCGRGIPMPRSRNVLAGSSGGRGPHVSLRTGAPAGAPDSNDAGLTLASVPIDLATILSNTAAGLSDAPFASDKDIEAHLVAAAADLAGSSAGHSEGGDADVHAQAADTTATDSVKDGKTRDELDLIAAETALASRPNGRYSCERPCGAWLDCGLHRCEEPCHPGDCHPCELSPDRVERCPCGGSALADLLLAPRQTCLDAIPTCKRQCAKTLACGLHACSLKCHNGDCEGCEAMVPTRCRCGSSVRDLACAAVNLPPDGKGKSKRREIRGGAGGAPLSRSTVVCTRLCKKWLVCGSHRCARQCCPWSSDAAAAALRDGAPPVGDGDAEAQPPGQGPGHMCLRVCGKPLACGNHTCDEFCHLGECPPCAVTSYAPLACRCGRTVISPPVLCGTEPPTCSHPCTVPRACGHPHAAWHTCHQGECPPCVSLVTRMCDGGHETRSSVPCSQRLLSCGRRCDKALACGQHKCQRVCHPGPCQDDQAVEGGGSVGDSSGGAGGAGSASRLTGAVSCGGRCSAQRRACSHSCGAVCHPGEPCPATPCSEHITIRCSCGALNAEVQCLLGGPASGAAADELEALLRTRKLDCEERCGFTSRLSETSEASVFSADLIAFASVHQDLARRLETRMRELLKNPRTSRGITLPPQPRSERIFVHDLANAYGLTTTSYEEEPRRYVRVNKPPPPSASAREMQKQIFGRPLLVLPSTTLQSLVAKRAAATAESRAAADASGSAGRRFHAQEPEIRDMRPDEIGCILHLFDMRASVTESSVSDVLNIAARRDEYELTRLDDHNALVTFSSKERARRVFEAITSRAGMMMPFKVRFWGVGVGEGAGSSGRLGLSGSATSSRRSTGAAMALAAGASASRPSALPLRPAWGSGSSTLAAVKSAPSRPAASAQQARGPVWGSKRRDVDAWGDGESRRGTGSSGGREGQGGADDEDLGPETPTAAPPLPFVGRTKPAEGGGAGDGGWRQREAAKQQAALESREAAAAAAAPGGWKPAASSSKGGAAAAGFVDAPVGIEPTPSAFEALSEAIDSPVPDDWEAEANAEFGDAASDS